MNNKIIGKVGEYPADIFVPFSLLHIFFPQNSELTAHKKDSDLHLFFIKFCKGIKTMLCPCLSFVRFELILCLVTEDNIVISKCIRL